MKISLYLIYITLFITSLTLFSQEKRVVIKGLFNTKLIPEDITCECNGNSKTNFILNEEFGNNKELTGIIDLSKIKKNTSITCRFILVGKYIKYYNQTFNLNENSNIEIKLDLKDYIILSAKDSFLKKSVKEIIFYEEYREKAFDTKTGYYYYFFDDDELKHRKIKIIASSSGYDARLS